MFTPGGIIALTTDFQADSFYIAEMKVAAHRVARDAMIVDVTHAIAPQDVKQASWTLLRAIEAFPEGTVHVVVVDPGVGTNRKILAAMIHGQVIIGPDNGLFDVVASRYPVTAVVELNNEVYFGPRRSCTFHGRDIMAPVAGHLVRGIPLVSLGDAIHRPLVTPQAKANSFAEGTENEIHGQFVYADSFGNCVTNIFEDDIPDDWDRSQLRVESGLFSVNGIASTYGEREPGASVALLGSSGQLEWAVVQGSAAQKYGFNVGTAVKIVRESH
ncbi:SAM hydrolase/SAM-dependent halogenase family protein [Bremerella alba]|uniref:Adenosyl-chloride synthase n=1 Tax=Bremerella alba TaxID=980252 RepID=A0A7V8V866_9BACT|nr:SAM-dependent chlorinase/fluorinase [Bremerella alba]MBA2116441.1 Adenosyl-chloride synthase [Bremerella alba]